MATVPILSGSDLTRERRSWGRGTDEFCRELRLQPPWEPGRPPRTEGFTFESWAQQWCAGLLHLRPATRARYELEVRLHIVPRFGPSRLTEITWRDVSDWVADMTATGERASAVRRRFSVLRRIFADALATHLVVSNPCDDVRLPADRRGEVVVLNAAEVRDLAGSINPWFPSWVWFAAYSGLSWPEMLGVRRTDIDLRGRTVTVRQEIIEIHGRFLGFREPKTEAGKRTVDLPAFLCGMLETQLEGRAQPGPDGLAFVNTRGNPPHASNFASQIWVPARLAVGRPDLRWHDLRDTAVALAVAQGADPKAVQERMGHPSVSFTVNRYGYLFPSLGRQIAEGLDRTYLESLSASPAPGPGTRRSRSRSMGGSG